MDGLTLVHEFGCDEPMLKMFLSAFRHTYTGELSLGGAWEVTKDCMQSRRKIRVEIPDVSCR